MVNYKSKQIIKMSVFFALFFLPFIWCVAGLIVGAWVQTVSLEIPTSGGGLEAYGFGVVVTGIGTALFGRELYESIQSSRSMRRRR